MLILGFLVIGGPQVSQGAANVLFILDGSGSMQGQVEGKPKIDIAKQVLAALLKDLPADTKVGLMVYGHRSEKNCKDIEMLAPVGQHDLNQLVKRLQAIKPKGKTPLAYSLEQSTPVFANFSGQNNAVVLVSDGIETCGGDPCKTAEKLAAANIGLKVHVVGFDVAEAERQQLECIAKEGKGKYFPAKDASGLKQAFAQVKQEVVQVKPQPKPEPPRTKFKEYFFDDLDGSKLKEHWEVLNPNPDNYTVEKGSLLVVNSSSLKLNHEKIENLFRLSKPLPEGDWVMTAKMTISFQTNREMVFLGFYNAPDSFIAVTLSSYWSGVSGTAKGVITLDKNLRGAVTRFQRDFWQAKGTSFQDLIKTMPQPLLLRLRKEGHSYYAAVMLLAAEKPQWAELEKVTALQAKGMPILGIYQEDKGSGESLVHFDWVKIETPE
jgi:hypothetical protein